MAEKPILVAGKSGQLARCLRDLAVLRNVPMVAVGRPELDLETGEGIERVMAAVQPSAIVNAAAYTAVDKAEVELARAFAVNCGGAALLAGAAARRAIPFIHISTDYVFEGSKRSPYREDDVPAPQNIYGSSKLASESAVLKVNPCATVLRTSWVYSPYGNNFVRTMLRLSRTQPMVRVVDDQRGIDGQDEPGAVTSQRSRAETPQQDQTERHQQMFDNHELQHAARQENVHQRIGLDGVAELDCAERQRRVEHVGGQDDDGGEYPEIVVALHALQLSKLRTSAK